MGAVADREGYVGFVGLVGAGASAYAMSRGWRVLGGAGALASLALIYHCYKTYHYRAPLRDFQAMKGLEGKVLNLERIPKELWVEGFGDRRTGWLAGNLGSIVEDSSMKPNVFEAAMDHALGSEDALAQNFETIRKTLDHGHPYYPAYMRAIVTQLLESDDPFEYLDGELLGYATEAQKSASAKKHEEAIKSDLSIFWRAVLAYQHCPDLKGKAKEIIGEMDLSGAASRFHFGADAFAVLRELEMLTADVCWELYGVESEKGIDQWANAIHYFELETKEDTKLHLFWKAKASSCSLQPNLTLAFALATKDELFAAVLKKYPDFITAAADGVDCPELWEKLKDGELFNEVFAKFASDRNVTRNELGNHLLDPDFFAAVIDEAAETNEHWAEAMRTAKDNASDEVVGRLSEAQESYLGEQ